MEIRLTAGHTLANLWRKMSKHQPVTYNELLSDIAKRLGVQPDHGTDEQLEQRIVSKLWNDTLIKLTPEQREELIRKAQEEAEQHGISSATWAGTAALGGGLVAANLAGFSLYIAASTILGAINGAMGLGLGFGAFMGMSKLISLAIGPAGWVFFVVSLFVGFGGANYKKVIPIVVMITAYRHDLAVQLAKAFDAGNAEAWVSVLGEIPIDISTRRNRLSFIKRTAIKGHSAWPEETRWRLLANIIEFLEGNDGISGELIDWFKGAIENDQTATLTMTRSLVVYVSEIASERKNAFLELLLDVDTQFLPLCYSSATDFSTAHYRAIFTITDQLVKSLQIH